MILLKIALYPGNKGAPAIRRIFSLVDIITNTTFSNCLSVFKLVWFDSNIRIVSFKIRFKVIHHLQSRDNLRFLLPPLIICLYSGFHLEQTLSICTACLQKVKVLKCLG